MYWRQISYHHLNVCSHPPTHACMHPYSWAFLEIHAQEGAVPDDKLAYMAGQIEGALTGELIYMHYANTLGMDYCPDSGARHKAAPSPDFCNELDTFLNTNELYLEAEINKNPYSDYWYQVRREQCTNGNRENKESITCYICLYVCVDEISFLT